MRDAQAGFAPTREWRIVRGDEAGRCGADSAWPRISRGAKIPRVGACWADCRRASIEAGGCPHRAGPWFRLIHIRHLPVDARRQGKLPCRPMAIRFQCPSCSQPIEVDDELASKVVGCPYCRKTVAAPLESTLVALACFPTASPLQAAEGAALSDHAAPSAYRAARGSSNPLAVIAFALACGVLVLLFAINAVAAGHSMELEQFQKDLTRSGTGLSSQLEAMNKFVQERGGTFPAWFIALALLEFTALATCLAAIVCGILALRRAARRPLAIAALAICGLFLMVSCLGAVLL